MRTILWVLLGLFQCLLAISIVRAQEDTTAPSGPRQLVQRDQLPSPIPRTHRFWDATNLGLFAGVAATRALDYASTRHFRARGVNEWLLTNDIVDNKPLFIGIEVAGTAASIGTSYLFHRFGRHKIERWVSIIHISVGT